MPLYTAEELDAEIAQAKLDLAKARRALQTSIDTGGGSRRQVQRDTVKAIQDNLAWLESERQKLTTSAVPRRTFAKQGGRG